VVSLTAASTEYETTKKPEHFLAEIIPPYYGPFSPPQFSGNAVTAGNKIHFA